MKKNGFEVGDYNLPLSVRKRIDELVNLNIHPSTINLITGEFSFANEETKENIGRYIARLLEIEDFYINAAYEKIKQENGFLNLKQELNIKNRQTNLLRIQQIFSKKDQSENTIVQKTKDIRETPEALTKFKDAMVINNSEKNFEKERLQELANKKRKIELAILEEQQTIKTAQKQYQRAKLKDDTITQELKVNVVKFANKRLKEIANAIATYKTIEDIPYEIIEKDKNKNKQFSKKKEKSYFENLQSEIKKTNEIANAHHYNQNIDGDSENFFEVPGFDVPDKKKCESRFLNEDNLNDKKKPIQEKNIVKKNLENNFGFDEDEIDFDLEIKYDLENDDFDDDEIDFGYNKNKNNETSKTNESSRYNLKNKVEEVELNPEKVIKKIKKKMRAKDRQIAKITHEKEEIEKELTKLKEENKINELRDLESRKRKLIENFEETIKREKRKIETTYQILEKKWKAETINQSLNSKQKAFNAVKKIKEKSNFSDKNENDDSDNNSSKKNRDKKSNAFRNSDFSRSNKISFSNKSDISLELKKQQDFEDNEKAITLLERKRVLNLITDDELKELEIKKKKNQHNSVKIDLKKYKLLTKNSYDFNEK